jgi:hypothetical protein
MLEMITLMPLKLRGSFNLADKINHHQNMRPQKMKDNLTHSDPMSDLIRNYDFPVPDAFPHVVRTLTNR